MPHSRVRMTSGHLPSGRRTIVEHASARTSTAVRHASFFVPVAMLVVLAAASASGMVGGHGPLACSFVALATFNMRLLALSAWPSLLGEIVLLAKRFVRIEGLAPPAPTGKARTAILVPIHEEDPIEVFAAVEVMRASYLWTSVGDIDLFVLSDTRSEDVSRAERMAHSALVARISEEEGDVRVEGSPSRAVHYRRRKDNGHRKAGNVRDFCERWGAGYDFMVVLDADSLMSGRTIAHMIGTMEANPSAGIVQSMCYPIGRSSLFGRAQQFAARLHGPALAAGASFWQGPNGSWWGHNAIIRIESFMRNCGLPDLPGKAPLGGEILCHDTIEAALMLRGGREVWLLPDVGGSFEQTPTNFVDHLSRERRWCQGNMQHMRALRMDGLKAASFVHVGTGILHYLSAPSFVLFLAVSALCSTHGAFASGNRAWACVLLVEMLFLLSVPRMTALATAMADPAARRGFGGGWRLLLGAAASQTIAVLTGPTTILAYVGYLCATFFGTGVGWNAQARSDRGVGWREATTMFAPHVLAGTCGCVVLAASGAGWWSWLPSLPGVLLGIPFAVWTSRSGVGDRLFTTVEEVLPPRELLDLAVARNASWVSHVVDHPLPRETRSVMRTQSFAEAPDTAFVPDGTTPPVSSGA